MIALLAFKYIAHPGAFPWTDIFQNGYRPRTDACDVAVREISWLTYLLAIVLVVYFVFVRSRMG